MDTVWKCLHGTVFVLFTSCRSHHRPRARFTILNRTMQISCQNVNRTQIDAVSPFTRQMKLYRFGNTLLLVAFSNRPNFADGVDCCRVNGRRNRLENGAVTNETALV